MEAGVGVGPGGARHSQQRHRLRGEQDRDRAGHYLLGGSFVCDQFGKVLFRAGEEEGVFTVDVDLGLGKLVEGGWGFMRNRKSKPS